MTRSNRFVVILSLICFLTMSVNAQKAVQKLARNYYIAGPQKSEVQFIEATPKCQNWCWAACAQILLNFDGLKVTQEQIVKRINADLPCEEGNAEDLMKALNGWTPASVERISKVRSLQVSYDASELVGHLATGWPIIVGVDSRSVAEQVYVLTAVYFSMDQWDSPTIDEVVLRNPWPLSPSEEVMRWDAFKAKNPKFYDVWVE